MKRPTAYKLGQAITGAAALLTAAILVLLAVGLLITAARAAWWLTTDHPLVAILCAVAGVLLVGRKL